MAKITLEFLVALLLAILVFVPACLVASKLFQFSSQAKANFDDFVQEIKEVQESPEGKGSQILIIDENSAIIGFNPGKRTILRWKEDHYWWKDPPPACLGEACVCLLREISFTFEKKEDKGYSEILAENQFCEKLEGFVFAPYKEKTLVERVIPSEKEKGFSPEYEKEMVEVETLTEGGFIILRSDEFLIGYPFNLPSRRAEIRLEKTPEGITLCKQSPCPS